MTLKSKHLILASAFALCASCFRNIDEAGIYTTYSGKDNGETVSLALSRDGIYELQLGGEKYMGPWEIDRESSLCDGYPSGIPVYYYNYLRIPYSDERRKVLPEELGDKRTGPISGDCIRMGPFGRLFMSWDAENDTFITEVR